MHEGAKGFSLVELSIVLVILGLLTGGILGGQSLIQAAQLRSVYTEYDQWQTATNTFKARYFQLPGDMTNAEDFWGTAATCPPTAGTVVDDGVCDGNGNGRIGDHQDASEIYEQFMYWLELSKAGLIPGTYSGAVGTASQYHAIIGTNVPASKYSGGGWTSRYRDNVPAGEPFWFAGDYGNALVFGAQFTTITIEALLTPQETWNLDSKFDDGYPGKGIIMARLWNTCTLAANNQDYDAEYDLTLDSAECSLSFRNAF